MYYTEKQVIHILEFFMDTICRVRTVYCSTNYRHPMGTNCLSNMLLYSHDTKIIQKQTTFRYIDNFLSINNTKCTNCIPLTYPQQNLYKKQALFGI